MNATGATLLPIRLGSSCWCESYTEQRITRWNTHAAPNPNKTSTQILTIRGKYGSHSTKPAAQLALTPTPTHEWVVNHDALDQKTELLKCSRRYSAQLIGYSLQLAFGPELVKQSDLDHQRICHCFHLHTASLSNESEKA